MKKAIMFIASFAFLIISISAFTDRATAPAVGYMAPEFALRDSLGGEFSLNSLRGNNVLVSFWSSTDANSRIRCNHYDTVTDDNGNVKHLAVNFDNEQSMFNEIVRLDNLTASEQYHVEGHAAANIKEIYHLDRGLHSFLINQSGRIIAIDPDDSLIRTL